MQLSLSTFSVVPQSNVRTGNASLDKLIPAQKESQNPFDLSFSSEDEKFKIKSSFLTGKADEGYTVTFDEKSDLVVLLQTKESDKNEDLRPIFFKGNTATTKSDYLKLLSVTKLKAEGFYLLPVTVDEYKGFIISTTPAPKPEDSKPKEDNAKPADLVTSNDDSVANSPTENIAPATNEATEIKVDEFPLADEPTPAPVEEKIEFHAPEEILESVVTDAPQIQGASTEDPSAF